jgi:hypothetical protein
MSDPYQTMKLSTIQVLFPECLQYIQDHIWDYVATNTTVLILLNNDQLGLSHLESIHRQIEADKAEKIKEEAEAQKKTRVDPHSLTGGAGAWRQ